MLTGRAGRSEHDVEFFVAVQSVDRRERPVLGRTVGRNDHDAGPFNTSTTSSTCTRPVSHVATNSMIRLLEAGAL